MFEFETSNDEFDTTHHGQTQCDPSTFQGMTGQAIRNSFFSDSDLDQETIPGHVNDSLTVFRISNPNPSEQLCLFNNDVVQNIYSPFEPELTFALESDPFRDDFQFW
jgi:hypothetical protein